jgi:hypothetical protein
MAQAAQAQRRKVRHTKYEIVKRMIFGANYTELARTQVSNCVGDIHRYGIWG